MWRCLFRIIEIAQEAYWIQTNISPPRCWDTSRIIKSAKVTFFPLIFSLTGGVCPWASNAIQRMASKISDKKEDSYLDVITIINTNLNFALLRSSILCLRGARAMRPAVAYCSGSLNRNHCRGRKAVVLNVSIFFPNPDSRSLHIKSWLLYIISTLILILML